MSKLKRLVLIERCYFSMYIMNFINIQTYYFFQTYYEGGGRSKKFDIWLTITSILSIFVIAVNIVFVRQFFNMGVFFIKTMGKTFNFNIGRSRCVLICLTIILSLSLMFDYYYWIIDTLFKLIGLTGKDYTIIMLIISLLI